MPKFWIVTNSNTTHTNNCSARFHNIEDAIGEATRRVEKGNTESVFILECVKVVKRVKIPVSVEDVDNTAPTMARPSMRIRKETEEEI